MDTPSASSRKGNSKRVHEDDDEEMDIDSPPGIPIAPPPVTVDTIAEIAGVIPTPTLLTLTSTLFPKSTSKSIRYTEIAKVVETMIAEGWSAAQTVGQLYETVMFDERVEDLKKVRLVGVFSETDKRLVDGGDEHLAVLDLGVRVAGVLCAS